MLIHASPLFQIYFGDASDGLYSNDYLHLAPEKTLLETPPFDQLKKSIQIDSLAFLKQIHSTTGFEVSTEQSIKPFQNEGDFLYTLSSGIGLGVVTADCLPIVIHDAVHNALAVVHAGWRGSLNGIAGKALEQLHKTYGTEPAHVKVFFGPSAKACCYTIGENVLHELQDVCHYSDEVLHTQDDGVHFDLPGFNRIALQELGVKPEAFHCEYNLCTICDESFYSYRRQGQSAGRQMTVAVLL